MIVFYHTDLNKRNKMTNVDSLWSTFKLSVVIRSMASIEKLLKPKIKPP